MKEKLAAIQKSAANWLWYNHRSRRYGWRFKIWIALRVQWLFFKRWWNENVSLRNLLGGLRRQTTLLLIGLGLPLLMAWLIPFDTLVKPVAKDGAVQLTDQLAWKELIQPILLLIGLPSAFILWAFRDHNASAALENQRKDINLKEFQEIQLRAAGALDEKLPAKARETLQVAAIHQLRPFLRAEYGASFRRPAWELLKAILATSAEASGYTAIIAWVEAGGFPKIEGESATNLAKRNSEEIENKIFAVRPNAVALAGQMVIREEAARLLRSDLPLQGGHFDGVELSGTLLTYSVLSDASFVAARLSHAHLERAKLPRAHLAGADLRYAHLEGADLSDAHLQGAYLGCAHLERAYLARAHLERADLNYAHLEGACLNDAHLEGAYLVVTHLEHADLRDAHLQGAYLLSVSLDDNTRFWGARYDDDTAFADSWDSLTEVEREAARKPWRDRGMIHVDEVKRDE